MILLEFLKICAVYCSIYFFFVNIEKFGLNFDIFDMVYGNDIDMEDIDMKDMKDMKDMDKNMDKDIEKYENKYLDYVRNMNDYEFSEFEWNEANDGMDDQTIEENIKRAFEIRHKKLKNCFIIEKTPLGNVSMFYNAEKETFEYYSDNTLPYRFLETVCRKYIKTFQCKELYIDMEEELKQYQEKMQKKEIEKKEIEKKEIEKKETEKTRKNVFAAFKSYNREGSGRVNMALAPKNSIPNPSFKNQNPILKEKANHYSCIGRFSNFNILQKPDKRETNKHYLMTFADFKKIEK